LQLYLLDLAGAAAPTASAAAATPAAAASADKLNGARRGLAQGIEAAWQRLG
jgi:hypothetical protein